MTIKAEQEVLVEVGVEGFLTIQADMEEQAVLVVEAEEAEEMPRGSLRMQPPRGKQVYLGVREVRGKLCPMGQDLVMVEVEVEVEPWEERYL
jgi:hypothetical protein